MKISIATQGSRGDVQPYLALAIALKAAGFEPTLVAPPNFQEWVEGFGIRFIGVGPDYSEVLASDAIRRWLEGKPGGLLEGWRGRLGEMVDAALESAIVAAENGDAILYDMKIIGAPDVAEATGKPTICISYLPNTTPTPSFPVPMFPLMQMFFAENHGPFVNSMTHVSGRLLRSFPIGHVQKWRRQELGLKSELFFPRMAQTTKGFLPRLHFVSRHIAPPIDDRDDGVHTLGFLNLEDERDWSPSEELDAFLSEGEPPVFIGFGSMSTSDPERFTKTILEGVRLSGARAVLGTGWGGLNVGTNSKNVHVIDYAPYRKLFPKMGAVISHGGTGTTADALQAGKPKFVCAFSFDQPWWAARMKDLGVSPGSEWAHKLTPESLAQKIRMLLDTEEYHSNGAALADKMRAEDGARDGVACIKKLLNA